MIDFDDEPDREIRIQKMRAEIERLGGIYWVDPDGMTADLEETFLREVLSCDCCKRRPS